jgi:recombinational DNA repair protein (RecF pathway)
LNGLMPNYDYCSSCGRCVKDEGFFAWPQAGQGCCRACAAGEGIEIKPESARLLRDVFQLSPERFEATAAPDPAIGGLERLTQSLLELHLDKRLKAYKSLRELLRGRTG